ncbi:MAG: hypothetical protein IPM29_11580 [Planctomycetes bacterium]|nr:hypothetical protein [Planctomycetota bacterium]
MNRTSPTILVAAFAVGLSTSVRAQAGPTSPGHFASVEAPLSSTLPLAHAQQVLRIQQIHDDLPFRPRLVRGLAFRRNSATATFAGFAADLDLTMSSPARSSATPSNVFADNHGANPILVVARRTIQFAGTQAPRTMPAPFDYVIPFDVPYSVSLAACWDVRVYAHGSTNAEFDAVQSPGGDPNPDSGFHRFGVGCRASGAGQPMAISGTSSGDWSLGTFTMRVSSQNGLANTPHVATLGFDSEQWGQTPLPFLLPGSLGAPSGACFIETDILDTLAGTSNGVGTFAKTFGLTLTPAQHGLRVFSQVVALDTNANSLGLVVSNASVRQFVAPFARPPVAQIAVLGSQSATGTATAGVGVITRFVE